MARGAHRELGDLGHGGVPPEAQLVLAEAVAGQDLALVLVPLQRAHLQPPAALSTSTRGRSSTWEADTAPCLSTHKWLATRHVAVV
jgi:hypothetical protein